jgi:CAAX protease family protein
MNSLARFLTRSPIIPRVAPFAVFLGLTFFQAGFGEAGAYWFYLAKTLVGAWMLWVVRSVVTEMRWNLSWEALLAGVVVFALWVALKRVVPDQQELWVKLGLSKARTEDAPEWNPFRYFGEGSVFAWFFATARLLGSTLVVPPLEEVFYRSFLYRWILKQHFETVPLGQFAWKPFVVTALLFGFAHNEWLAGILCGVVYQGVVCWKKRLGDAITAHAVTNFLLGLWVVWKGAWHFW